MSVVNRHLNMFTLIALGVGAAFSYSVVATLAPGLFPDAFRMAGQVAVYFEPAAVIVVLVLLGQVLELRARSRTGAAIRNLLSLAPKTARRIDQRGAEHDVPLELVVAGDRLRVRPGERVPVDGVVLEGATLDRQIRGEAARNLSCNEVRQRMTELLSQAARPYTAGRRRPAITASRLHHR
jgi:Cu+-exporting ATPase